MTQGSFSLPKTPRSLGDLFEQAAIPLPAGAPADKRLAAFADDSRLVEKDGLFIAVRGETVDGHQYITKALQAGAALVLAEEAPPGCDDARVVLMDATRVALPRLAHAWWGNPSSGIDVIGITGTNGKTTTAFLCEHLLRETGRHPALFSTVEYRMDDIREDAPTTTPGALHLARRMAEFRLRGADAIVMEVSSHALAQGRVDAIRFQVGLMTNLTQDHLDYHNTMEEYAAAKQLLFKKHRPQWSIFNLDDAVCSRFAREAKGRVRTFGLELKEGADVYAVSVKTDQAGIQMEVVFPADKRALLESPLRGRFNASNLLAAASVGHALGITPEDIARHLKTAAGAPGRFDAVHAGQPFAVFVDYAHTPDAVERLLCGVREITPGRVICVLGCGGDRDAGKRPKMGHAMGLLADVPIITNDNPRTEAPEPIAEAMFEGVKDAGAQQKCEVILDRRAAIAHAVEIAETGDTVVIAGKGHETYQEQNGVRRHFDDREVAAELCRARYAGKDKPCD